jgi:hypothetical protein
MKSMFAKMGFGDKAFAWPTAGAAMPDMSHWLSIQQEMLAAATKFSQDVVATAKSDAELGGEVMRRLMTSKTPEEFAASQRDMFELVGSKYFEQWMKFGEQIQAVFAKAVTPAAAAAAPTAAPEPTGSTKPKKAA